MRVVISNYRNHWVSPYTILEYVFFWTAWSRSGRRKGYVPDAEVVDYPDWVERWSDRLVPLSQTIKWVLDFVHPRIEHVKIDPWDTWNMEQTLGMIALPMLRQLKEKKHGAPWVDDEDVPEELQSTAPGARDACKNDWDTDANHFKRWDWAMDEMIWAFEHHMDDAWEDEYYGFNTTGTSTVDMEGLKAMHARIQNGFRLFGKYYRSLWD